MFYVTETQAAKIEAFRVALAGYDAAILANVAARDAFRRSSSSQGLDAYAESEQAKERAASVYDAASNAILDDATFEDPRFNEFDFREGEYTIGAEPDLQGSLF